MSLSESSSIAISSDLFQYRRQLQLDLITFFHFLSEAQVLQTSSWFSYLITTVELLQTTSLFFLKDTGTIWVDANFDAISRMLSAMRFGFITDVIQYDSLLLWIVQIIILSTFVSSILIGRRIRQLKWTPPILAKIVLGVICESISSIFFVPVLGLLMNSMKCPNQGCNSSLYWIMLTLTLIALISLFCLMSLISLIMIHEQVNKSILSSGPITYSGFYRMLMIFILALLMLLCSSSRTLAAISSLAAVIITAYVAYVYTMYQPFYSVSYRKLMAASLWVICWAAICKFINCILVALDIEEAQLFISFIVGSALLAICICLICDARCSNILARSNEQLRSPLDYELKIRLLLLADGLTADSIKNLDIIWNECTTRFPLSFTAFFQRGNFYKLHTRRPYLALQMFNKAASLVSSLVEDIFVNRAKITINNLQLDAEFNQILKHEKDGKRARMLDATAAVTLVSFWDEASLASPDVTKIQQLMSKLSNDISAAEAYYKATLSHFPSDVSVLRSYAGYLIDIMNDMVLGHEISLRATDQSLIHKNESDHAAGLSDKSLHMVLSTDEKSFGVIRTVSQATCRLFGQTKSEFEGKHFSALSFGILKAYYTEMLLKHFQDLQIEQNRDKHPKLFAVHSDRSLIVAEMKLHCLIDSDELFIVGELNPLISDGHLHYILVELATEDNDSRIVSCSLQLSNLVGLSPDFVFNERLPVSNWLSDFDNDYESYASSKGAITDLIVSGRQDNDQINRTIPVTVQMEPIDVKGHSLGLITLKSEPVPVENFFHNPTISQVANPGGNRNHFALDHDDVQESVSSSSRSGDIPGNTQLDNSESKTESNDFDFLASNESDQLSEKQDDDVVVNFSRSHRSDDESISSAVTKRLIYSAKRLGLNDAFVQQNRKRHRLKKINIYLILLTLVASLSAVVMHSSTSALLDSWISSIRSVEQSGYLRYLLLSIVMMTKRFIQREQADSVRANLKVISDEFDAISNGLFADRLSLSPAHSDLLFSAPFPVQKLIDSDVITEKVTLWDTTRLIVSSTRSISNTERISDYDRHAFFLLQNYKSPILPGLNESTFQYEAAGQLIVSKLSRVIIIVSSVSLAMLSLFAILVIRPNICQVEQDSTNLLIRVLQVSSKVMLERRKKAMTRLVLLGEAESDAVYTNTDKVIQADEVKTHSKNVRNVIKKLRRVSIQQRVMITVKIIIPLLLLSAYYLLFCLIDYGAIKSNLSHSSSLINWTSYEQMAVRLVLLDEYNLIVLNNASIPSAEVNTAINELQRVHHSLIYGDQKGSTLNLIRNPSFPGQDKVLFRSACNGGGNCSSKFHGLLMNGLHVMILDYLRRSQQIVFNQSLVNRRSQFAELFDLESPSLQEIITGGITSLISNISDNIAQNHDAIGLVLLLIFILILAVMYRLIYAPLIANMAIREKHIDIISNLLPS